MREVIRLIVVGTRPEEIIRCISIVGKIRKYVQRYAAIHLLFMPGVGGRSGIAVEDETFVECNDDEESIEQVISSISKLISRKEFLEPILGAAIVNR